MRDGPSIKHASEGSYHRVERVSVDLVNIIIIIDITMGNKMCSCGAEETQEKANVDLGADAGQASAQDADANKLRMPAEAEVDEEARRVGDTLGRPNPTEECPELDATDEFKGRKMPIVSPEPIEANMRNESRHLNPSSRTHRLTQSNSRHGVSTLSENPHRVHHYTSYVAQALKALKSSRGLSADGDTDAEPAVMDSVLLKYKPGVVQQYLERWCRATRSVFSYYVSKATPKSWQNKPIITVPLECIETVQRVVVNSPEDSLRKKPEVHQFEIFLKATADQDRIFKSQAQSFANKSIASGSPPRKKTSGRLNESKSTLSKTPFEIKSIYLQEPQSDPKVHSPEQEPPLRKVHCEVMDQVILEHPPRKLGKHQPPLKKSQELLLVLDGAHFISQTEKEEYRQFKQTHLETLKKTISFRPKASADSQPASSGSPLHSKNSIGRSAWSHREAEWASAERRLLFASDSEETCDNWVCVLNWLISRRSSELKAQQRDSFLTR